MSISAFDELEQALHRRGDPMSLEDFLSVLGEATGHSEALTAGERNFLLDHTDLEPADLSEEVRAQTRLVTAQDSAAAQQEAASSVLSTGEVAELLGRAEANVRRSRLSGDLYAVPTGVGGRTLSFPRWQFTATGDVVPGLRRIIPALPADFHPLDVEAFMTGAHESLEGKTPVDWLTTGGSVQTVASLAEELSYQ